MTGNPSTPTIGGGPQGSQNGQNTYICASDDNADHVPLEDQFKYCDDLEVLELVLLGDILAEYDFKQHVASDIGIGQKFIDHRSCKMQENLNTIATWTDENLMQLNEEKSNYIIFTKARHDFASRLTPEQQTPGKKKGATIGWSLARREGRLGSEYS